MKTAVIYFSYTGKTKGVAEKKARKQSADLFEVCEEKKRSVVSAYVLGSIAAMQRKRAKIVPITCNLSSYDKIIVAVPIWAGYPAPAFNNIVEKLPNGKEIELVMVSASGDSQKSAAQTKEIVRNAGCKVLQYLEVKA